MKKIATGDEVGLVALTAYKLRGAGAIVISEVDCVVLVDPGYHTTKHLPTAEGIVRLAPPQPSEEVVELIRKAICYADVMAEAEKLRVKTCISRKRSRGERLLEGLPRTDFFTSSGCWNGRCARCGLFGCGCHDGRRRPVPPHAPTTTPSGQCLACGRFQCDCDL